MRASKAIHDVVVVDNEVEFLSELSEFIASDTRTVAPFTNPIDAIFHAKSHVFDTLVADFDMPPIDGVNLAYEFLKINPSTRIIIMSGRLINKNIIMSDWHLLSKPFGREQLEHCLYSVQ